MRPLQGQRKQTKNILSHPEGMHVKEQGQATGDFNARVQTKLGMDEDMIGYHTSDKDKTTLDKQDDCVIQNRQHMLDYARDTRQLVMNTFFDNPETLKVTYKEQKGAPRRGALDARNLRGT